jgi:imidazolonepropionase-like amidohydrolase
MVDTLPNLTPDKAEAYVKEQKSNGANYIKLMQENCCALGMPTNAIPVATLELQTAVVKAAHDQGLPVVGHALSVDMTEIVLKSGADGLTHTFIDQPPPRSIIDLYKQTGAFVIPTLCALSSLTNEFQDRRDKFADLGRKKGILDEFSQQNMKEFLGMKDPAAKVEYAFETLKQLRKEGVDIVAGTDAVAGLKGTGLGPSLWMELELYIDKCDFSPTEALHAATALPAKRFGFSDRGEVTEGRRADLVLMKGDVTQRLQNIWEGEGIAGVWKEGLRAP